MAGIKKLLPILFNDTLHLVTILDMVGESQELTSFFCVIPFGYLLGYGLESIDKKELCLVQFMYDKSRTQFRLKPCSFRGHDLSTIGNVHNLLHGDGIKS